MERPYRGPPSLSLWPAGSPRLVSPSHSINRKPVASPTPSFASHPPYADASVSELTTSTSPMKTATSFVQPSPLSDANFHYSPLQNPYSSPLENPYSSPTHPATSLIQQPPHVTTGGQRLQPSWWLRGWYFEALCVLLSIGAVVSIAAVLKVFDGRPLSDWDFQVTLGSHSPIKISLNFVVSVLGILAKSATAVVLSAGLSQLKWNWFATQHRPITDFELFDSASRGPTGSVQLLWRTRAIRIASLGAFLTILSIVFDPFLQLLIDYPGAITDVQDHAVTVPVAHQYTGGTEIQHSMVFAPFPDGTVFHGRSTQADADIVGAAQNALWNTHTRIEPDYACAGGNCTWPDHVSLAVCAACHDLTDAVTISHVSDYSCGGNPDASTMVQPDATEFFLDGPSFNISMVKCDLKLLDSVTTTFPNQTINFRDSQTLLMAFTAMWTDDEHRYTHETVHAAECGLMLCANTYRPRVELGNYTEAIVESHSARVPASWQPVDPSMNDRSYVLHGDTIPLGPSIWPPVERTDFAVQLSPAQAALAGVEGFHLPQHAIDALVEFIAPLFHRADPAATGTGNATKGAVTFQQARVQYDTPALQALWSAPAVPTVFENLASDLSAVVRSRGPDSETPPVPGSRQRYDVVIAIHWPFLAVPIAIVVLAAVFVCVAVVQTRAARTPVWKEGALATLVWGLDGATRAAAREAWAPTGPTEAPPIHLTFRGNKSRGELVTHHGS